MASIFDRDSKLLLINCDCGNIISDAPSSIAVTCHDCERCYLVDGENVTLVEGNIPAPTEEQLADLRAQLQEAGQQVADLTRQLVQFNQTMEQANKLAVKDQHTIGTLTRQLAEAKQERDKTIKMCVDWSEKAMDAETDLGQLQAQLAEAREQTKTISQNAVNLLGANCCEAHAKHINGQHFYEFSEEHTALGCAYCNKERLAEAEAAGCALRLALEDAIPYLEYGHKQGMGLGGEAAVHRLKYAKAALSTSTGKALAERIHRLEEIARLAGEVTGHDTGIECAEGCRHWEQLRAALDHLKEGQE